MEDSQSKYLLDGLKMMGDWSKWLVTLNTVAITALSFTIRLRFSDDIVLANWFIALICLILLCFLLSAFFATILLYKLPGIVQQLPSLDANSHIYYLGKRKDGKRLTTGTLMWWQQAFFLAGLALSAISIIILYFI